ncbi:MAG: amidophosphoribosyltransferase [Verrucomicrobiota bacterium]|nr:amidophosphoribosyltransferase [Verrucomicrobiota bacterium]MEC8313789.1 amidophosphoribosyltransferase [Verrucomicrobiota bacterium]
MSEWIGHECGIAAIRLLKPLDYYIEKYGTPLYGIDKLTLLMEKQHNRGQDGAGAAVIKLDMPPGNPYIFRTRSASDNPLIDVRNRLVKPFLDANDNFPEHYQNGEWIKRNVLFAGELLLGHLRYGTHGSSGETFCHPFLRQNNWMTRNLVLAGNFNLTNNNEMFEMLVELGQHPRNRTDTVVVLEKIGHFLDEAIDAIFRKYKSKGLEHTEITNCIVNELDLNLVLRKATKAFDGGYVMAGMIGHGDLFVLRDPAGIRPAFYYADEEVVVVTSERPQIKTAFDIPINKIKEVNPGHALIVKKDGSIFHEKINEPISKKPCSFERIYFSRGTDLDIYKERKQLGHSLVNKVLEAIDFDLTNSVFSYIPNTAETAFFGMIEGLRSFSANATLDAIKANKDITDVEKIIKIQPRVEKLMTKDGKLRTFITADTDRTDLVAKVYDTTYGLINDTDTLIVLDDSIVRGTTLRECIFRILDRLGMKKIIVVSTAPQIRYPDCYGIDMSKMNEFIAFEAAISLTIKNKNEKLLEEIYSDALNDENKSVKNSVNTVKRLYDCYSADELSKEITSILTPSSLNAQTEILFQSIEGLHAACPDHKGDWYFTGDYPTPGGNRVANRSFINFMEKKNIRAY